MKRNFFGLDLLRFGLAVYLMVYHTIDVFPQAGQLPLHEWLRLGGFATSTFFILSGFILSHVYFGQASISLKGGSSAFLLKRLSNLYPVHLISLSLFLLVALAGVNPLNRFALSTLDGAPSQIVSLNWLGTAFNLILNGLMLQAWNPFYFSINPPSWSLSVLLFFYLIFIVSASRLLALRRKWTALALTFLIYLVPPLVASLMHWYGPLAVGLIETNPLLRLPEFLGGVLLYGLLRDHRLDGMTSSLARRAALLGFVLISFSAAALVLAHEPIAWQYMIHNGALMPAEILLIVLFMKVKLSGRAATYSARLGNAALSIFAIHIPLFLLFIKLQKLFMIGQSPLQCMRHLSVCIQASRSAEVDMTGYPYYLFAVVIAAVLFQEKCVVPLRDALRAQFLKRSRLSDHEGIELGQVAPQQERHALPQPRRAG